jgi:hypothetical protein
MLSKRIWVAQHLKKKTTRAMKTKLTLTIEKDIIQKAKSYAKKSGRSLSDLIESYLKRIISDPENGEEDVPEEFKDLFGSVNLPIEIDDKTAIRAIASNIQKG